MIKDEDVAHYPEVSRERMADIFGTKIRVSTNHEGKIHYVTRHVPTEALALSFQPASITLLDEEASAEAELVDYVERWKKTH